MRPKTRSAGGGVSYAHPASAVDINAPGIVPGLALPTGANATTNGTPERYAHGGAVLRETGADTTGDSHAHGVPSDYNLPAATASGGATSAGVGTALPPDYTGLTVTVPDPTTTDEPLGSNNFLYDQFVKSQGFHQSKIILSAGCFMVAFLPVVQNYMFSNAFATAIFTLADKKDTSGYDVFSKFTSTCNLLVNVPISIISLMKVFYWMCLFAALSLRPNPKLPRLYGNNKRVAGEVFLAAMAIITSTYSYQMAEDAQSSNDAAQWYKSLGTLVPIVGLIVIAAQTTRLIIGLMTQSDPRIVATRKALKKGIASQGENPNAIIAYGNQKKDDVGSDNLKYVSLAVAVGLIAVYSLSFGRASFIPLEKFFKSTGVAYFFAVCAAASKDGFLAIPMARGIRRYFMRDCCGLGVDNAGAAQKQTSAPLLGDAPVALASSAAAVRATEPVGVHRVQLSSDASAVVPNKSATITTSLLANGHISSSAATSAVADVAVAIPPVASSSSSALVNVAAMKSDENVTSNDDKTPTSAEVSKCEYLYQRTQINSKLKFGLKCLIFGIALFSLGGACENVRKYNLFGMDPTNLSWTSVGVSFLFSSLAALPINFSDSCTVLLMTLVTIYQQRQISQHHQPMFAGLTLGEQKDLMALALYKDMDEKYDYEILKYIERCEKLTSDDKAGLDEKREIIVPIPKNPGYFSSCKFWQYKTSDEKEYYRIRLTEEGAALYNHKAILGGRLSRAIAGGYSPQSSPQGSPQTHVRTITTFGAAAV